MFFGCKGLNNLPDISKWNTSNVIDMNYMFCRCKALTSVPDISKWNLKKVRNYELYVQILQIFRNFEQFYDYGRIGICLSDYSMIWNVKFTE